MRRPFFLAATFLALISAAPYRHATRNTQHAQVASPPLQQSTDFELATRYAPVLYFHEREHFRPQPIAVMLDNGRLREVISGVEATLKDVITIEDLATVPGDVFIDIWYGSDNTSNYLNYTAHVSYYELNNLRETYPVTAYARVHRAGDGRMAIQYWLFYYYNDWYNKHEGDWEMVQVELDASGQPAQATYAQHHGGTVRPWSAVAKTGAHPHAYVALGSHATYFVGDALYPQGADVGNVRIDAYDRTGSFEPVIPELQMITDDDPLWLAFIGRWGERAFGDFSGPIGPKLKDDQWLTPLAWADRQPADADTWYRRNVRVDLDALPDAAALSVSTPGSGDIIVTEDRQTIVAHALPDPAFTYNLSVHALQPLSTTLFVEWPDTSAGLVTRREYRLSLDGGGSARAQMCAMCNFVLAVDSDGDGTPDRQAAPFRSTSTQVDFNPPEFVLFYLPFEQITTGLLIALVATVMPTAVYAAGVWWLDRYEKEPLRLLAITFFWGALPGAIVAIIARFFVAGVLAPVLTESVKALAIGFIFIRFRREFDDIVDGIVYGALAGIGFSMTINLITYVIGFFFGGFDFLRTSVLVNGIAFGLNEAYYGAVIGVGFGVSRWAKDRNVRARAPILGLIGAIVLHLFNDFWRDLAVGDQQWLVIIPFLATWAGIIAIVALVFFLLRREQETIRSHLKAEVERRTFTPNEFFYLSTPARRAQMALRDLRNGPAAFARAIQLQDLAAQLAFRRRELALYDHDPEADPAVVELRKRIAELRPKPVRRDNR